MADSIHRPGELIKIVVIVRPDYDSYAVIHLDGGSAFACSKAWFERERPEVGGYITVRNGARVVVQQLVGKP